MKISESHKFSRLILVFFKVSQAKKTEIWSETVVSLFFFSVEISHTALKRDYLFTFQLLLSILILLVLITIVIDISGAHINYKYDVMDNAVLTVFPFIKWESCTYTGKQNQMSSCKYCSILLLIEYNKCSPVNWEVFSFYHVAL